MVQIIEENRKPTFSENFGKAIRGGLQSFSEYQQERKKQQQLQLQNEQIKNKFGVDLSNVVDPDERKIILGQMLKQNAPAAKETPLQRAQREKYEQQTRSSQASQRHIASLRGEPDPNEPMQGENAQRQPQMGEQSPQQGQQGRKKIEDYSDSEVNELAAYKNDPDPDFKYIGNLFDQEQNRRKEKEKIEKKDIKEERAFHSSYSRKAVEEADDIRNTIPKLEFSLDFARRAVESGEVGAFSLANLGERLKIPELQTASGAQLVTAAKENLLGTMSQVSAKAQNIWFEQRVNSMMAQVGKSKEANLSAQELLEGELAMKVAYLKEFDRLSKEDNERYGVERKDIKMRAQQAAKTQQKHIFERTNYRLKELEEQEKGLNKLKDEVGKNVTKGTVLTLAMAKLYKDKFGDKAMDIIKKNGYTIPTLEEFKSYQLRPSEFREGL